MKCSEMDEEEGSPIISGDVENIIIKLEPTADFLDDEDSPTQEGLHSHINEVEGTTEKALHEYLPDNEVCVPSEANASNIVQIPFYLENYFGDDDNTNLNHDLVDMNHFACSYCKIIFSTEKILHEHLIGHIDIHRMGCNVCDTDLNTAEKYQLHVMAITRQSTYFCDLCKKSCAGVVRSKDQTRPEGKAYACHDCEITGNSYILSGSIPNIQHNRRFSNREAIFQSSHKKDGNFQSEIKLNGSRLNPDIFFHKCDFCDAFFAQSVTLSRHLRVRHNVSRNMINFLRNSQLANGETKINTFKYKDGEVVFSREQELVKHSKQEHDNKQVKLTNDKESLKTEVSSTKEFKCNQRDVSYSENINLTKHLREKHKKRKEKFTCKICPKQFRLRKCYNSHLSFHKCEKKTLTDVSQKRNLRRSRLRNS